MGDDPVDTIANSAAGFSYRYRAHGRVLACWRASGSVVTEIRVLDGAERPLPAARPLLCGVTGLAMTDTRDTRIAFRILTLRHMALFAAAGRRRRARSCCPGTVVAMMVVVRPWRDATCPVTSSHQRRARFCRSRSSRDMLRRRRRRRRRGAWGCPTPTRRTAASRAAPSPTASRGGAAGIRSRLTRTTTRAASTPPRSRRHPDLPARHPPVQSSS